MEQSPREWGRVRPDGKLHRVSQNLAVCGTGYVQYTQTAPPDNECILCIEREEIRDARMQRVRKRRR